MTRGRIKSFFVGALALFGAVALGYVVLCHAPSTESMKDKVSDAARSLQQSTMKPGTYSVQLESVELADEDWSTNSVTGNPKSVHMTISRGDKEVYRQVLGGFRGRKTFLDRPVTFNVEYDGNTPITLELAEADLLSNGKKHCLAEPWPFSQTKIGSASHVGFTWRRIEAHQ